MRRGIYAALGICVLAAPAFAAQPVNEGYVRSLAVSGKIVLVMEYYDGRGEVAERKGYATTNAFEALSATDFRVTGDTVVRLYGVEPCEGEMVSRRDGFIGRCRDYAQEQLQVMLNNPKVIFCRAFISERKSPVHNATCYGYYYFPGSLDTVEMFEEQLVSLGALRLSTKPDGTLARPDLSKAEEIGKKASFGMWADPRVRGR
ncbi:hypothetical protein [Neorhizobium petrolearium]|uniref:hypothetical protein n=1 Tax=Neorhizobium petrolearium TaxID=515361 RepID=UPI003F7E7D9B